MKNIKKLKNKLFLRIIFFIVLFVLFIFLSSSTILFLTKLHTSEIEKTFIYNETGKLDYSVCLKENEFIAEECISENRSFVNSLINHINLNLKYQLSSSNLVDYNYGYVVKAKVIANEKGESNKILYSQEYLLKEYSNSVEEANFININDNINVDFQKYNEVITAFKKNYVLAVDSKLIITASININAHHEDVDEQINNNYDLTISMPLAEQTVNIDNQSNSLSNSNSIVKYKDNVSKSRFYRIILSGIILLDVLYVLFIIGFLLFSVPKKKKYDKTVARILKNYDDFIVTAKSMPEIRNLNLIEVQTFDELLDAKEALDKPIIYYENESRDCSVFSIICDKDVYIFIVSAYLKDKNV